MSDQGHNLGQIPTTATPGAAPERRPLTADEMKAFDAMLGIAQANGPTLTRRNDTLPPEPPSDRSRLLQTLTVAIILLAIVAAALMMFR